MQNAVCWFIWFWYRFSSCSSVSRSFVRSFRLAVNMLSLQILRATKPTFEHNIHYPQALSTYSRLFLLLPTWHAHILIIRTHARPPAHTHSQRHINKASHQYPNIYAICDICTVYVNTCVCMSKIHFDSCSWNQNDKWCLELPASIAAELMLHWLKKNVTKISKCAIVNFPLIMDAWNIR